VPWFFERVIVRVPGILPGIAGFPTGIRDPPDRGRDFPDWGRDFPDWDRDFPDWDRRLASSDRGQTCHGVGAVLLGSQVPIWQEYTRYQCRGIVAGKGAGAPRPTEKKGIDRTSTLIRQQLNKCQD
jgi:hypothetical protein